MSGCYSQVSSDVTCEIADSVLTASLQIQPRVVKVYLNLEIIFKWNTNIPEEDKLWYRIPSTPHLCIQKLITNSR